MTEGEAKQFTEGLWIGAITGIGLTAVLGIIGFFVTISTGGL